MLVTIQPSPSIKDLGASLARPFTSGWVRDNDKGGKMEDNGFVIGARQDIDICIADWIDENIKALSDFVNKEEELSPNQKEAMIGCFELVQTQLKSGLELES